MSFYLDLALAVLAPGALLVAALIGSSARDLRRAGKAISLADRRIAIMTPRKARSLSAALESFLSTPSGYVAATDPKVLHRVRCLRAAAHQARHSLAASPAPAPTHTV